MIHQLQMNSSGNPILRKSTPTILSDANDKAPNLFPCNLRVLTSKTLVQKAIKLSTSLDLIKFDSIFPRRSCFN